MNFLEELPALNIPALTVYGIPAFMAFFGLYILINYFLDLKKQNNESIGQPARMNAQYRPVYRVLFICLLIIPLVIIFLFLISTDYYQNNIAAHGELKPFGGWLTFSFYLAIAAISILHAYRPQIRNKVQTNQSVLITAFQLLVLSSGLLFFFLLNSFS